MATTYTLVSVFELPKKYHFILCQDSHLIVGLSANDDVQRLDLPA